MNVMVKGEGNVIEAVALSHAYETATGWSKALDKFELQVRKNEFLCILGPSGCGKSSFLRMLAGLMTPLRGDLLVNGKPINGPGLDRAIVFQEAALFPWLTVMRNVTFGMEMAGWSKEKARKRAEDVLKIVGLSEAIDKYPYQLSGGMKHRVAVARAWSLEDASVLLMDEPFSAIDAINRMALQDYLVRAWLAEPRTVVYVTHDVEEAVALASRVIILTPSPGRIVADISIDQEWPRNRDSNEFNQLKAELTEKMRHSASN
jgi:ABC-type nitrate/sulfonate/bicarbonate transport system ATPase subunit